MTMRFVSTETVRIQLSPGPNGQEHWIEIKEELGAKDTLKMRGAGVKTMSPAADGRAAKMDLDFAELGLAKLHAYLTDWSDKRPLTPAAIDNLKEAEYEEILAAIQKHIDARDEEKKATSPSPKPTELSE